MNVLVIGDVHGCYHTLKKMVEEHWNPEREVLVQIGDIINKGPHSTECVQYWRSLETKYGRDMVIMIRGNHEQAFIDKSHEGTSELENQKLEDDALLHDVKPSNMRDWFAQLPLAWENESILITHGGIARKGKNLISIKAKSGVLYNKGPLRRLDKVQVKGHSVVTGDKPVFVPRENAWYIDTGAWNKKYLSAIRLDEEGEMINVFRVKTRKEDKRK